ncbi:MAG: integrase [Flavobacterium sp.]|nr:MAG: integrase [Flavobacterium sp.]
MSCAVFLSDLMHADQNNASDLVFFGYTGLYRLRRSIMHVQLERGLQVVARGKLSLILRAVDETSVEVIVISTREKLIVGLDEVEFIAKNEKNDAAPDILLMITLDAQATEQERNQAVKRFAVITKLVQGKITVEQAAGELSVAPAHIYKLRSKYDEGLGYCSLIVQRRGNKKGSRHLVDNIEVAISEAITKFKRKEGVSFAQVWREVQSNCDLLRLKCPARKTVQARIEASLSTKQITRMKSGRDIASQTHDGRPGKYNAKRPLELVQSDHTLVDVEVLSDDRKEVIGRPWLTLFIDVYSRVILGYYLSLHAPSSLSVACALTHSVMRKEDFFRRLGLSDYSYPIFGPPEMVYMDNAKEYCSPKYLRALERSHITYGHRPLGKKHYGGHVERLIGTMMNKVHLLSGSTMSNTVARKRLAKSKKPTQTFTEFSKWFALQVIEYHSTVHSEIAKSPLQAWNEYYNPHSITPYPPQISDEHQFRLRFMPEEYRCIRSRGIEFKGRFYWDPVLYSYVGEKKVVVKYDPFSLKQLWVQLNGQFVAIPFADMTLADISYEEHRASLFFSERLQPGTFAEPQAAQAYREAANIEEISIKLTKKARKRTAALLEYEKAYPFSDTALEAPKDLPDYSSSPKPFRRGD